MKRIRCPKCDEPILLDSSQYAPGRTLVFECKACHKQFRVRISAAKTSDAAPEPEGLTPRATLVVIENAFHLKQEIPLYDGDNVVGRHVPGTKANAAIKTVDPSVDTTHCIINVKTNEATGESTLTLRDANSNTGTFLHTTLLAAKARARLADGDIITIGATTMIVRMPNNDTAE